MEPANAWLHGTIALGIGGTLAVAMVMRLRKLAGSDTAEQMVLADLDEQVDHIVTLLRDLEEQKNRLELDSYKEQKARLEKEAAAALRARDEHLQRKPPKEKTKKFKYPEEARSSGPRKKSHASPEGPDAVVGFLDKNPQLKGFLWGGVTVGIIGLVFWLLSGSMSPRAEGQSLTGNDGGAAAPMAQPAQPDRSQPPNDPELLQALEVLKKDPENVGAMVTMTQRLLFLQMLNEAAIINQRALQLEPKNPQVRIHAAVLQSARGNAEGALKMFDEVLAENPNLADGWFFRGMVGMQTQRPEIAQESWKKFVAVAPDGPRKERIKGFLEGKGLQMPGQR